MKWEIRTSGEGTWVMSVADAIHDYHERTLPHLARLRMLSGGEAAASPSPGVAAEVATATRAVLAQAEAASRLALAASRHGSRDGGPGLYLAAGIALLTAAAEDAVAAARDGDAAALRQRLLRFDTLTSAIYVAEGPAAERALPRALARNGGK